MKASDLMIGDWVYYENSPVQIKGIDSFKGEYVSFGDEFYPCKDFKPILLTPEILEKIGFVKYIAWQYVLPEMEGEILVSIMHMKGLPNADSEWLVAIKNGYIDVNIAITYVHELQQALKLCGIKKEIIL